MKNLLLRAALLGGLLLASLAAGAADQAPLPEASPAMKARCEADPAKCEEVKKRMAAHRAACKQDPVACKQRHEAARQKMKEQCQADPAQCKAKHEKHARKTKSAPATSVPAEMPETTTQ